MNKLWSPNDNENKISDDLEFENEKFAIFLSQCQTS